MSPTVLFGRYDVPIGSDDAPIVSWTPSAAKTIEIVVRIERRTHSGGGSGTDSANSGFATVVVGR